LRKLRHIHCQTQEFPKGIETPLHCIVRRYGKDAVA
jgi:hypothetical protein